MVHVLRTLRRLRAGLAFCRRSWAVIVRERCPDCGRKLIAQHGRAVPRYCGNPECRVDGRIVNMLYRL